MWDSTFNKNGESGRNTDVLKSRQIDDTLKKVDRSVQEYRCGDYYWKEWWSHLDCSDEMPNIKCVWNRGLAE